MRISHEYISKLANYIARTRLDNYGQFVSFSQLGYILLLEQPAFLSVSIWIRLHCILS